MSTNRSFYFRREWCIYPWQAADKEDHNVLSQGGLRSGCASDRKRQALKRRNTLNRSCSELDPRKKTRERQQCCALNFGGRFGSAFFCVQYSFRCALGLWRVLFKERASPPPRLFFFVFRLNIWWMLKRKRRWYICEGGLHTNAFGHRKRGITAAGETTAFGTYVEGGRMFLMRITCSTRFWTSLACMGIGRWEKGFDFSVDGAYTFILGVFFSPRAWDSGYMLHNIVVGETRYIQQHICKLLVVKMEEVDLPLSLHVSYKQLVARRKKKQQLPTCRHAWWHWYFLLAGESRSKIEIASSEDRPKCPISVFFRYFLQNRSARRHQFWRILRRCPLPSGIPRPFGGGSAALRNNKKKTQ